MSRSDRGDAGGASTPRARGRRLAWIGALLWAASIFVESSSTDVGGVLAVLPPGADKVAHALAYAVLGALLAWATGRPGLAVALATLYGVSDELHQAFVPGRTPDVLDLVADLLGATAGAAAVGFHHRRRRRRRIE